MCTQKMRALSYKGAKKITFPHKPDIQTDIHTDGRTDISVYRVASLLKNVFPLQNYNINASDIPTSQKKNLIVFQLQISTIIDLLK